MMLERLVNPQDIMLTLSIELIKKNMITETNCRIFIGLALGTF